MSDQPVERPRPLFIVQDDFLETPFERRFQGYLRQAWQNRSWHIIAALPGSGKSWGISDLVLHSGARKETTGMTYLPLLAVRAPANSARESALVAILSNAFGVLPKMSESARRVWLVQEMARDGVDCIIIDDAHELTLAHLALLKELTDNLLLPPYQRRIGLCLVAACGGNVIPFKATLAGPETLWRQFRGRMALENPYRIVPGHSEEEVYDILTTLEEIYRPQLPDLNLRQWTKSIFTWLTNPILDPDTTGRVTMNYLTQLVTAALKRAFHAGATDVDAGTLQEVADLMILRRDEITLTDDVPPWQEPPEQGAG